MLDVAAVACGIWDHCLRPPLRRRIARSLGKDARAKFIFLSGAHDLGKASPGFQKKFPILSQNSGLEFSENDQHHPHGLIGAYVLNEILGSSSASDILARIAGGHHGVFPRSIDLQLGRDTLGGNSWRTARLNLVGEFSANVDFDLNERARAKSEITDPAIIPILAGFISVADWIGSDQNFFPCAINCGTPVKINAAKYWKQAQSQAQKALEKLGWLPAVIYANEARFDTVFSDYIPNSLQKITVDLVSRQTFPYLMIVEAPMGQGKTEAAFYAADIAMCRGFARGMYIAMPTQATGNAMFKRVLNNYLKRRGHQGKLNLQLVHGDALLSRMAEVQEGEISTYEPGCIAGEDDSGADMEAQSWFTARKRPLLAPFGVGTIDQSLLSVLQTRHWFVRLFGLAGKVVIFDEIHAYDAFMSTILERLLHWLAEVDCTVILLSATLPEAKRRAFAVAYSGRDDIEYQSYPRITLVRPRHYPDAQTDCTPICAEIPVEGSRTVGIRFIATDLMTLTAALNQRLEHGGCGAVICNTVDRSIAIYKHLRENLKDTDCILFHARTLQMWRRMREEEILRKFGKGGKQPDGTYVNPYRPTRAVLVATQVIEQSLDLDFDLMVSEIAPIDLLFQRSGRLHRHLRQRPLGLESAQIVVLCDAERSGPPPRSFGGSIELVYSRYILLRTWLALRGRIKFEIPAEIEELVEAVYGGSCLDCSEAWNDALEQAKRQMEHDRSESIKAASLMLVSKPGNPSDLIEQFNSQLVDEEDPEAHKAIRAATREGDPSITAVMIPADMVLPDNPGITAVRSLLDRSVKLSHRGLFKTLLNEGERPKQWANNAHLRHARLLRLDERHQARVGNYIVTANEKMGIVIIKGGGSND